MVTIKNLFKDFFEDYEDTVARELNLTVLHQIILGMIGIDLETQLSLTTADIDARCSVGRTPLHWATVRSDLRTMQLLIDFGASLTVTTFYQRSVVYEAARHGSIEALRLLLDTISSNAQHNPHLAHLISQPDSFGTSPLETAICESKTDHASLLLQFQCAIDPLPGCSQTAPILVAIQYNTHEILRSLLGRGARTDVVDYDQFGILHMAASQADLETLLILLHHDGPLNASTTALNLDGKTPMGCFEEMQGPWFRAAEDRELRDKYREAFLSLLNKVNLYQLTLE